MFTQQQVQSLNVQDIKLNNLVVCTLSDQPLRKNFQIALQNFKRVQQRFQINQEKFKAFFQSLNNKLDSRDEKIHSRLDQVFSNQFLFDQRIVKLQNKIAELCIQIADKEAKLLDFTNFRKTFIKIVEKERQKLDQTKLAVSDIQKQLNKIGQMLPKKTDKIEMQKTRRDLGNIQLRLQSSLKKQKQIQDSVQKLTAQQNKHDTRSSNIINKIGQQGYEHLLGEISIMLNRTQDTSRFKLQKSYLNQTIQSKGPDKKKKREGDSIPIPDDIQGLQQKLQETDIKVNKLVQLQKNRDKNNFTTQIISKIKEMKLLSSPQQENRINQLVKNQQFLRSRVEVNQQKIIIFEKKNQALRYSLESLQNRFKNQNQTKLEQRLKQIQVETITNFKDINNKLQNKTEIKVFQQRNLQINQRIKNVLAAIALKSDKSQVKKALHFLQSKLKEIIMIVSQQEENVKDALATKKLIKCLSCDKELDKLQGIINEQGHAMRIFPPSQQRHTMTQSNFLKKRRMMMRSQGQDSQFQ